MGIDQEGVRQRIKAIKESKFMNQTEFAEAIGIKQGDLSRILSGKRPIGNSIINKIIIAFSINRAWLLTGQRDKELSENNSAKKPIEDAETVKELIAAIKRRDEHVDALIRVNEKHADNLAELIKQMKKTDAPKGGGAECADASGFSDK